MDVDRGLWWSVWWPWVAVLIVGVLALVVAVVAFVLAWQHRHRVPAARKVPGLAIYLDKETVESAHRLGGGVDDLIAKEVTHRVGVTKDGKLAIPGAPLDIGKATSSEIIETYVKKHDALDVVGLLLNALEKGNDVLHVNLSKLTVGRNAALEQVRSKDGVTPGQLYDLGSFVLVEGEFRHAGIGDGTRVYLAAIGAAGDGPRVRVECETEWLLLPKRITDVPSRAVCLGQVESWKDPELRIWPIAIFR